MNLKIFMELATKYYNFPKTLNKKSLKSYMNMQKSLTKIENS